MHLSILGLFFFIALAKGATTPAPVECMTDADCQHNECCYKKHDLLVVSKKRQQHTFEGYPVNPDNYADRPGVCQSYKGDDEYCTPFDTRNGYCSCNVKEGLSCQFIQDSSANNAGSYRCKGGLMLS